jgi:hypothetical protein
MDAADAAASMEQNLTRILDPYDALYALQDYGEWEYPYGFKIHTIVGMLARYPYDENTWFLKYTCDVTNANGATAKNLTVEGMVTGTSANPQVIYFVVY